MKRDIIVALSVGIMFTSSKQSNSVMSSDCSNILALRHVLCLHWPCIPTTKKRSRTAFMTLITPIFIIISKKNSDCPLFI